MGLLNSYIAKGLIKDAGAEWAGLKEVTAFFAYMSSKEKKSALRVATMLGTKKYRRALRAATPVGKVSKEYSNIATKKRTRRLKDTVGIHQSKKYKAKDDSEISPFWVGHLVKKGAYHQHLIVRGTRKWTQNDTPLRRSRKGGGKKRRKIMVFISGGKVVIGRTRRRMAPNDYVSKIADKYKDGITNDFGNYFTAAMKREARKPKYKKYLN